jgi:hypothetical protein
MNLKSFCCYGLSIFFIFLFKSCAFSGDNSNSKNNDLIIADTILVSNLEPVVTTESGLLASPAELEIIDDGGFAVYDNRLNRVIIFNQQGTKELEFGSRGSGPGEWDHGGGARDLNYKNGYFLTEDQARFMFHIHNRKGEFIYSVQFPHYIVNYHKILVSEDRLLVSTNGKEGALAILLDLNNDGEVLQKIGVPESEPLIIRNHEQERLAYANGEIPDDARNSALVAAGADAYYLFMNTLGELRRYSLEGELQWKISLPESIKEPIFDFVSRRNKDVRPNFVFSLDYAQDIKVVNEHIYVYMPKLNQEAEDLHTRILVYDENGALVRHLIFDYSHEEFHLHEFGINTDDSIYFIDWISAQILRFQLGS